MRLLPTVLNQAATLYRASHTLKRCSATVGALSLAALCETLESATRRGSIPDPAAGVEAMPTNTSASKQLWQGRCTAIIIS